MGLALLIVVAVPDFALVLGVLGSACSFSVTVFFPCACYLRLFWHEVRWRRAGMQVKGGIRFVLVRTEFNTNSGCNVKL